MVLNMVTSFKEGETGTHKHVGKIRNAEYCVDGLKFDGSFQGKAA